MNHPALSKFILCSLLLLLSFPPSHLSADEAPLRIGAVYPLSGPAAHLGESNRRGARLAVDLINQAGGINGQAVKLLLEDSKTEPAAGVSAFRKLVSVHKVPAVLTTLTSVSMAVRSIAESESVVLLAESTHPDLVKGMQYTFRHFFTGPAGASALSRYLVEQNISRLAILHAAEEFGEAAANGLEKELEGKVGVVARESFMKEESDLRAQVLRIKSSNPNFVYVIGLGAPVAVAIRQIKELGLSAEIGGYVICGQSEIIDSAGPLLNGTYSVEPFIDRNSQAYKDLELVHRKRYPDKRIDQSTIAAFDAVNIIAMAFRSGAKKGNEIRKYLRSTLEYSSAMGAVSFVNSADSVVPMVVSKVQDGRCI